MERWLFTFFIGAILSLFSPIVPDFSQVFICLFIAFIFCIFKPLRYYSGFFFGCAWLLSAGYAYQNIWLTNNISPDDFVGKTVVIKGEVANIPTRVDKTVKAGETSQQTLRFNFIVDEFNQQKLTDKIKLRLRWDRSKTLTAPGKGTEKISEPSVKMQQGQQWQLTVRIKPAHGFANIGGFSYQTWLRQKALHATGYVRHSADNKFIQSQSSYRQVLYNELTELLTTLSFNNATEHFILALTFGERSKITAAQWQVLQATGTQHLMAISGLHLGLIASGTFGLVIVFLRYFPFRFFHSILPATFYAWLLTKNSRVMAFILSGTMAFFYAYLAGFSLPTLRALVMLLIFIAAKLLSVKLSTTRWLLLSVVSITLLMPFSVFSVSFWLSIYAVTLIFLIIWRCQRLFSVTTKTRLQTVKSWFLSLIIVQLGLSLFMLPVAALLNYQLPLSALLANIIAVPWMSFTAIPLSLLSVIAMPISERLSLVILELSLQSLAFIWQWLNYLASKQWLFIDISHDALMMLFLVIGCVFIGIFFSLSKKIISALLLSLSSFVFINTFHQPKNNAWQVNVLDVGQGLSVVIERNGHAILYDTGASYPSGFNLAQSAALPYLKYQGIKKLDYVILSHADNDHAGGLAFIAEQVVLKKITVGEIKSNIKAIEQYNLIEKSTCKQGDNFTWQALTFSVLWPVVLQDKENDNSCVINISDGKHSILLTGDISRKVEKQLLAHDDLSSQLIADVIVAPHHGSKTSSSYPFIKAVSPEAVIFSAGFLNRWYMPNTEVVQRYQQLGIEQYSTAKQGMIRIEIKPKGLEIESYREHIKPYWFAN
jgi:competence protein ComEC